MTGEGTRPSPARPAIPSSTGGRVLNEGSTATRVAPGLPGPTRPVGARPRLLSSSELTTGTRPTSPTRPRTSSLAAVAALTGRMVTGEGTRPSQARQAITSSMGWRVWNEGSAATRVIPGLPGATKPAGVGPRLLSSSELTTRTRFALPTSPRTSSPAAVAALAGRLVTGEGTRPSPVRMTNSPYTGVRVSNEGSAAPRPRPRLQVIRVVDQEEEGKASV